MKKKCSCGGLEKYAEGGRTRVPTRNTRFLDPEAERIRGRSALEALRGYAGAPSQSSAMYPGSQEAYESGELAGMAEMLIPGASLAKGALGAALAGVIKPRGGNWLIGDVESSISKLLRRVEGAEIDPEMIKEHMDVAGVDLAPDYALNRWIEGPLTKYIKRDMATPEDPVRRLADEGILHMGIPQTVGASSRGIQAARKLAGFPEEGLSTTPGGSLWENLSDLVIDSGPARYLQEEPKVMAENPWMQKLDPESTVYTMPASIERGLGLDHLVDELNNALNPDSGLPRHLLLRPEQLQQMGMEKAVRHVDAINKWRESQRAAANQELANKALTVREYPDTPELPNPKGLRWVELGGTPLPQDRITAVETDSGWRVKDKFQTPRFKEDPLGYPTREEALAAHAARRDFSDLEKQLKYEGDAMGHCVGGYCDEVLEGNSRIFSLRDAKGEPHVTIEVAPPGRGPSSWIPEDEEHPVMWPDIIQIKGKGNSAPKDEYLPFVQDFVRNSPLGGTWGDVGDLGNARLHRLEDESGIKYLTPEEYSLPRKKEGGLVTQPDYFDDLDAFLRR